MLKIENRPAQGGWDLNTGEYVEGVVDAVEINGYNEAINQHPEHTPQDISEALAVSGLAQHAELVQERVEFVRSHMMQTPEVQA